MSDVILFDAVTQNRDRYLERTPRPGVTRPGDVDDAPGYAVSRPLNFVTRAAAPGRFGASDKKFCACLWRVLFLPSHCSRDERDERAVGLHTGGASHQS